MPDGCPRGVMVKALGTEIVANEFVWFGLVWFVGFYGISTFVGYLMPNPFLCKSVLFKTIQFCMSTQFNCQKHIYFKLFKQLYIAIQFSVSTVSMSKTFLFQTIQAVLYNNSV